MTEAIACGKLNLSLRVGRRRDDGLHEVAGVFQSIGWTDYLALDRGEPDGIFPVGVGAVPDDGDNLAWRAVTAVRDAAGITDPLRLGLAKRLPVAAGLGGGSADAAAALALAGTVLGVDGDALAGIAPALGSDVPFCLRGGTALVAGAGEEVTPLEPATGFGLVVVVPPIELSTAAVYRRWDELDGPSGPPLDAGHLPPSVRELAPLANDLYPAAVAEEPAVDEWRRELAVRFGRPVALSGSGPSLFAYFVDVEEAEAALEEVPAGARATWAGAPVPFGWAVREAPEAPVTDSRGRDWKNGDASRWSGLPWRP